jgi:hypothetical protein
MTLEAVLPVWKTHFPINHVGFIVADIASAVEHWSMLMGAGPFFLLEHIKFDFAEYDKAPCTLDSSSAFGQCGSIAIELQQIHAVTPDALGTRMQFGGSGVLNHVGYVGRSIEAESARLSAMGFPLFFRAGAGEMEARFHDTAAALGYAIEIHRRCDFIENFFIELARSAREWDGSQPLRHWTGSFE